MRKTYNVRIYRLEPTQYGTCYRLNGSKESVNYDETLSVVRDMIEKKDHRRRSQYDNRLIVEGKGYDGDYYRIEVSDIVK